MSWSLTEDTSRTYQLSVEIDGKSSLVRLDAALAGDGVRGCAHGEIIKTVAVYVQGADGASEELAKLQNVKAIWARVSTSRRFIIIKTFVYFILSFFYFFLCYRPISELEHDKQTMSDEDTRSVTIYTGNVYRTLEPRGTQLLRTPYSEKNYT